MHFIPLGFWKIQKDNVESHHIFYQEGVISETYQTPYWSYFQEPQKLHSLVNVGKLVQQFLLKQADIDKILKIIPRKVLKETHLPVTVKEIQAGYLVSPYFKDLYLYLAQNVA